MTDFTKVQQALERRGYTVRTFAAAAEAAAYLDGAIDGKTVGFGGSATLDARGVDDKLAAHNTVIWHWKQEANAARKAAMQTQVYLSSANGLAESGEIVNIDGTGNRVSATLFGHEKVYFVIGRNKLAPTYEAALDEGRTELAVRVGYWGEDGQARVEETVAQLREARGLAETPPWTISYYPAQGPVGLIEFVMGGDAAAAAEENSENLAEES